MHRTGQHFAVVALAIAAAPFLHADAINSLTLTPMGTDTVVAIAGTYTASTPVTAFSSPDVPYSLTFILPTMPLALDFSDPVGVFALDRTVTLDGVVFPNSQAVFFESSLGGGLAVCLSQACNPTSPVSPEWDIPGDQLFTGSVDAPTFISGSANFDAAQSSYNITAPVPEPSTVTMGAIGIGLSVLPFWRRRRTG